MRRIRDLEEVKSALRDHVDLVKFVERYVPLQQRGQRWIGFCPFHDDKNNPGFGVSPETVYEPTGSKGVWACWTCDARGDLFAFAQRINDVSFIEAIELVAEITDFDLTSYYRELSPEEQLREQRYATLGLVADLFCDQLLENKKKLAFYTKRGLQEDILRQFKVGWSPGLDFVRANLDRDVIDLIEPRLPNRINLFADRYLYPQFTTGGQVWGWYARQPDDRSEGTPKYVGVSKDAPLFDGTDRLYGFSFARKLARKSEFPFIIVEGFHDALAAQQAGFAAIGACGTALTAKQIETLQTHSVRAATVVFDPDDAGRDGALEIARGAHKIRGIKFEFATTSSEPEEFIAHHGADAFGDCLKDAVGAIDFIVARYDDLDTSTATKKRDFLDHLRPFLLPYPRRSLDRALGVQAVAQRTGLPVEVVSDYLDEQGDNPLSNLAGELIVLAELAINPQAWVTLAGVVAQDFSLKRYSQTFELMTLLREREAEVNLALLVSFAHNEGAPQEVKDVIGKLYTVSRKTPEIFARDIRDKAVRRRTQEYAVTLGRQAGDLKAPVSETVATLIEGVTEAMNGRDNKTSFSSVEAVTLTEIELERKMDTDAPLSGLDLGPDFAWYTQMLNGMRPRRVNIIAAASGVGKSLLLMNFVHRLSVAEHFDGAPAPMAAGLIASMEMEPDENIVRLAAIDSDVPHSFIDNWRLYDVQANDVVASLDRIRAARLTWLSGQRTVRDIAMQARILQARGELDYIAIDYVQLLDLSQYPDRWSVTEKYNQASQDLHALAKSLHVPIIACAQLNRSAMAEELPTGEQMGSSYKIYQDAHTCFILAPRNNDGGLIGSLDKNRGSGKGAVKLSFDNNPQTSTLMVREIEVLKRGTGR